MKQLLTTGLFVGVLFIGLQTPAAEANTVVDIALSDDNFSALVDAVVSEDLVDTLNGDGPFTVFAPTNDAFTSLPGYVTYALEKDPTVLKDILLYHVVADDLVAADVLEKNRLTTVQGERVRVSANDDGAFINQSELIDLDLTADNGVVHVIDRVLIPRSVYQAAITGLRADIAAIRSTIKEARVDLRLDRGNH